MLTLNDGRKELYQWDTGRIATIDIDCDVVHFSNLKYGDSLAVEVKEGEVAIPNKLLMSGAQIYCWAFAKDDSGAYTKQEQTLPVIKRAKPSDYVYTETETLTWKSLDERITELEKGGTGGSGIDGEDGATFIPYVSESGIISWTNDKGLRNPEPVNIKGERGEPGKDGINGRDGVDGKDGKNGADGTTPHIGENGNWFIGDTDTGVPAKGEGASVMVGATSETDGTSGLVPAPAAGDDGKFLAGDGTWKTPASSGGGTDLSLGVSGAAVGQTVRITAVDEDGKPTEWESADIGGWELITDITLTEDGGASGLNVTRNDRGEDFEYRQCMVCLSGTVIDGWPSGAYILIKLNENNDLTGSYAAISLTRLGAGTGGTTYKTTVEMSIFGNLVRTIACGGSSDTSSLILRSETTIDTFRSIALSCYGNNQWTTAPLATGGRVVIYGRK